MASLPIDNESYEVSEEVKQRREARRAALKAEIEVMLAQQAAHRPSPEKMAAFLEYVERAQSRPPLTPGPFPTAEEMIREDRDR
jgi:hypothetical protein